MKSDWLQRFDSIHAFISILCLVSFLCGCASKQTVRQQNLQPLPAAVPAAAGPVDAVGDLRREHNAAFSLQEQNIIAAARQYLEKQDRLPVDAYYRVTHVSDHYEVYVQFVSGYHGAHPEFVPGRFCIVLVRDDGSVVNVFPGA